MSLLFTAVLVAFILERGYAMDKKQALYVALIPTLVGGEKAFVVAPTFAKSEFEACKNLGLDFDQADWGMIINTRIKAGSEEFEVTLFRLPGVSISAEELQEALKDSKPRTF